MRLINVPETITINTTENRATGPVTVSVPFTFLDLLSAMLQGDRRFNQSAKGAFAAERIQARMRLYQSDLDALVVEQAKVTAVREHQDAAYEQSSEAFRLARRAWDDQCQDLLDAALDAHNAARMAWAAACDERVREATEAHTRAMAAWENAGGASSDAPEPVYAPPAMPEQPAYTAPTMPQEPSAPAVPPEVLSPPAPRLLFETADGELLKEVMAEPTDGYPIKPLFVIAAYLRAVAEQTEVDR